MSKKRGEEDVLELVKGTVVVIHRENRSLLFESIGAHVRCNASQ